MEDLLVASSTGPEAVLPGPDDPPRIRLLRGSRCGRPARRHASGGGHLVEEAEHVDQPAVGVALDHVEPLDQVLRTRGPELPAEPRLVVVTVDRAVEPEAHP